VRLGPALALLLYTCLSLVLFGRDVLGDIRHVVEGSGPSPAYYGRDQSIYVWSLAHGARALTHLSDPFLTSAVFAPGGYNLAWATSLFGPALIAAPATLLFGAIAGYDLLALLAPAAAAWTAYLLCREVTARSGPAFAGGLLFGFGTYESVEMVNHLNLALVALLPLALLLVLRRHGGRISRRRFIICLGVLLALQMWTSTEVFASMALFGAIAFLVALILAAGVESRASIARTALETLPALLLALLLSSPYLYFAARYSNPVSSVSATDAGVDLANFLIPTTVTWLHPLFSATAAMKLRGNITEQVAYFGLPLLLILAAFAVEFRRSVLGRCLILFTLLSALLALGSRAHLEGKSLGISLPWSVLGELPLLRFATPGRFLLYAWLAAALATSCWLARGRRPALRWGAFLLIVISLAPNLTGMPWGTRVSTPRLFAAASRSASLIPSGATVLALPFGIAGDSMYWQVEDSFRFRLAGGYLSISLPSDYRPYIHLIRALEGGPVSAAAERQLCPFIRFTGTEVIVLSDGSPGRWSELLGPLRVRPRVIGGLSVYELIGRGDRLRGACGL
jgi:hypothetical protein